MNNCTLLIDGNWLLISRFSVLQETFRTTHTEAELEAAQHNLEDCMARSINITINRLPFITNMILVTDGGSWRKHLPKPSCLNEDYKGNREDDEEPDISWDHVWEALNHLQESCAAAGITSCHHKYIEGDDWIWHWSRYLNDHDSNCIIWSSDADLKQLVQCKNGYFTAWYNSTKPGRVVFHQDMQDKPLTDKEDDFFMSPMVSKNPTQLSIEKLVPNIEYINPDDIVISKIICGDSSDNIKSVARITKNNRTYGVGPKELERLLEALNINDLESFFISRNEVLDRIRTNNKFNNTVSMNDINEMFDFNTKLVWLNENIIPGDIKNAMKEVEYKKIDISDFRNSYTSLLPKEDKQDIENIFDSIKP